MVETRYKRIQKIAYKDIKEFTTNILDCLYYSFDDFSCVNIVSKYDDAINLINYLVKTTDIKIKNMEINESDVNGYSDEYIISICKNFEMWCEPAKNNSGFYKNVCDDTTFVSAESNEEFIIENKDNADLSIYKIIKMD